MRFFRIGIIVMILLMCIPRKVQAFENTICSISDFHCIIKVMERVHYVSVLLYEK